MIDTDQLKSSIDLLALIVNDTELKRKASTGGGEYAGPCPFCGGRDRFCVQPNHQEGGRWLCRNCSEGKWQDVIAYVMRRDAVNFVEACLRLGISDRFYSQPCNSNPKISERKPQSPPSLQWQTQARQFVSYCEKKLWSEYGKRAKEWLNARGLRNETLRKWSIGYNPKEKFAPLAAWGLCDPNDGKRHAVWLPRGVVVPCIVDAVIWYVKIRRPEEEPKMIHVKLPETASGVALFGAENLWGHDIVVLPEGEWDCLLLDQEVGDLIGAATLGSASARLDISIWARFLLPVSRFLIAYDVDGKSERGVQALTALSARMRRINIPQLRPGDKDITDYWKSGGNLRDWIIFEMKRNASKIIVENP